MRTSEIIKLMPTQYKRTSEYSSLYSGHHIPLIGYWTKAEGYVKKQSLKDDSVGESLACPIIAVVTKKVGNTPVTLTITGKKSSYKTTRTRRRGEYTISTKIYEPTSDTITSTLTIPAYTRPWGTFLISGLGREVYEITTITDNVDFDTGKIEFYALASAGSKIIYWLGIHKLAEQLREILRPWIAPTRCSRCRATGIEPNTEDTPCKQCLGYKYDGYSSTKYVQRKLGADVGLARKVLDWDNLTPDDHEIIRKFVNKAWTQKWWVTPTKGEIQRLIRHFYMIENDDFDIVERFHGQEPVWSLYLPVNPDTTAPFGQSTVDDRKLMRYIAESVTPAGVSVFVAFFEYSEFLGELDLEDGCVIYPPRPITSWEDQFAIWGSPRWDLWNGWQEAIHDFEDGTGMSLDCSGNVSCGSGAKRLNANDRFRHVCKLDGSGSYYQVDLGTGYASGTVEWWVHPSTSLTRMSIINEGLEEVITLDYDSADGSFRTQERIIDLMCHDSEKHCRIDFKSCSLNTRSFTIDDDGVDLINIPIIIDMSSWENKPSASDWTNYVRLTRVVGGVEEEINSQPVDQNWDGGDHNALVFLIEDSSNDYTYYVYYGDTDLGAPGYTSDLTVTADSPAAGDFTVQQDDYYKIVLSDQASNKWIAPIYTRVSGVDVRLDRAAFPWAGGRLAVHDGVRWYYSHIDIDGSLVQVEGITGANSGAILTAFKRTGYLYDGAGNYLLDDSANRVSFEIKMIFFNNQLWKSIQSVIATDQVSNVFIMLVSPDTQFLKGYFSHKSYKYSSTHWVGGWGSLNLDAHWTNKKYLCLFDTTSNDGVASHYILDEFPVGTPLWRFYYGPNIDAFTSRPTHNNNINISSGKTSFEVVHQFDDFTEADGVNDNDGDQPAHRKNTELLTTYSLNLGDYNYFFDVDIYLNRDLKFSNSCDVFKGTGLPRYLKWYNRNDGISHVDAIGYKMIGMSGTYNINDNWQTLYPFRWGLSHENCVDEECDLFQKYFFLDKPIKSDYP